MDEMIAFIESDDRTEKRVVVLQSDLDDLKRTFYDNGSRSARDLAESEWSHKMESLKNDHANAMTVLRRKLKSEREAHAASLARAVAVQEELRAKVNPLPMPVIPPIRSAPVMPSLAMSGVGTRDFNIPSFGGNDTQLASLGQLNLSLTPSGKDISAFLSEAISSSEDED